jgi:hypothetical protein
MLPQHQNIGKIQQKHISSMEAKVDRVGKRVLRQGYHVTDVVVM